MKLKRIGKSKKSQALSIVFFFVIMLATFVLVFLMMSLVNTVLNPFQTNINATSVQAGSAVQSVNNAFNK